MARKGIEVGRARNARGTVNLVNFPLGEILRLPRALLAGGRFLKGRAQ